MMTYALSWFAVQARLELAKAHLALSDPHGAATLSRDAGDILHRRPRLGTLVAEAEGVRTKLSTVADQSSGWASTLTAAELRLLAPSDHPPLRSGRSRSGYSSPATP